MNKVAIKPKMSDSIKYAVIFWGFTAVCGVYLIPAMILAYVNPFWFRKELQNSLSRQIDFLTTVRGFLVKPITDKYRAFQILKTA